jgi:hypothetical protein
MTSITLGDTNDVVARTTRDQEYTSKYFPLELVVVDYWGEKEQVRIRMSRGAALELIEELQGALQADDRKLQRRKALIAHAKKAEETA